MSKRGDSEFFSDIREALNRISDYVAGTDYESFAEDIKTQDAVIRNIEILGEATKNLSEEFREQHPSVPWQSMAAARDRLIHHYFGVNLDIVWQIAAVEVPRVAAQLDADEDSSKSGS